MLLIELASYFALLQVLVGVRLFLFFIYLCQKVPSVVLERERWLLLVELGIVLILIYGRAIRVFGQREEQA